MTADEYVVLPVELGAGESRRLGLVFDPTKELKGRLVAEPAARIAPTYQPEGVVVLEACPSKGLVPERYGSLESGL